MKFKILYQENNHIYTKVINSESKEVLPQNIIKIKKVKSFYEYFKLNFSSYDEVVDIFKELSIILDTNLSLGEAIEILLKGNKNKNINELLKTIKISLQNAHPIDKALQKHQKYIGDLPILFFKLGIENGNIKDSIKSLSTILISNQTAKKQFLDALIYPIILSITLFLSIILIFNFVIPKFEHIFIQFGSNLPLATKYLLNFKNFIENYYIIIAIFIALCIVAIKYVYYKYRIVFDKFIVIKIPLISQLYKQFIFFRLFLSIQMLIKSNYQFQIALKSSRYITNNEFILYKINHIINDIQNGKNISQAFENTKLFNHIIIRLLHTAQETNTLPLIVEKITTIYTQSLKDEINKFSTAIGPIFILIISTFILWIILAIMLPIWELRSVLN